MIKVKRAIARPYTRLVLGGEPSVGKTKGAYEWAKRLQSEGSDESPALWVDLDQRIPEEIIECCDVLEGIRDYNGLRTALKSVLEENEFKWKALIIDTVTIMESFARDYSIIKDYNDDASKYASYTSGDKQTLPLHVNVILSLLDKIASKHECDIILICHSEILPTKNVNGENYDKASLSLSLKIRNRILQWADYVGFAWEVVTVKTDGLAKKASGDGTRMITFSNSPKWDAKGPAHCPEEIVFDFEGNWVDQVQKKKPVNAKPVESKEEVKEELPTKPSKPTRSK